ncbi:MAG: DUF177 domain-containing protein [Bacilli bacterium]|nr:DUF177 domain-containing protein [Bacilli bacterium]
MKINFRNYKKLNNQTFHEKMIFDKASIENVNSLLDINDTNVTVTLRDYDDIIRLEIDVTSTLTLQCSYTLEPIEYPVDISEDLDFTFEETEDENLIHIEQNEIDINQYIFGLLLTEIPMKIVKEGATLPKDGKGYQVMTEDEYIKMKESEPDERFSILDSLDIDENN